MPVIDYMTGAELAESAVQTYQAVAGMSASEAAAALNSAEYAITQGSNILSFPMVEQAAETVVRSGESASEAWSYYAQEVEMGAAGMSALGAAANGAIKWAQGVLFGDPETAGTLAGAGGLLTMSLPAAAAAIAPLLGVSLGTLLYESNPELWTKISRTLLPFCYDDTDVMPVVYDPVSGNAYAPQDAVDALKDLFDEEGIGKPSGQDSDFSVDGVDFTGTAYSQSVHEGTYWTEDGDIFFKGNDFTGDMLGTRLGQDLILLYSESPWTYCWVGGDYYGAQVFNYVESYTYNGKTVYYSHGVLHYSYNIKPTAFTESDISPSNEYARIAWHMLFGVPESFPPGTLGWSGVHGPIDPNKEIYVVVDSSGNLEPYYPIPLNPGDPTITIDPDVQSDPTAPVELPSLNPFISPSTSPESWPEFSPEIPYTSPDEKVAPQTITDPQYVPEPNLNPDVDPSPQPDPEPAPQLPEPPPPTPGGSSPPPIFPVAPFPSIVPSSGSGLVHVYNPTPAEFIAFGNWLWVTYADPSIEKLWNNPFDGVIGAHELYATPSKDGTDTIKSGFLDSGISSTIVQIRYTTINCGSIVIPEYYANYLDYSPYSKAYIYLPFIGIVEVDVDDIVGHSVNITYKVDSYNGSCIALVTVAREDYENTVYQFSGNCAVDVPLAGGSQAAIRAGLISAAAYTIGGIASGGLSGGNFGVAGAAVGAGVGAINGLTSGIAHAVSQKSTVQHSGSFGASYGAMGIKTPYIIIRRPIQKQVVDYEKDYGFPAHKRVIVGSCTGYLRVKEVNVLSSLATDEEKILIEERLKSGVYIY